MLTRNYTSRVSPNVCSEYLYRQGTKHPSIHPEVSLQQLVTGCKGIRRKEPLPAISGNQYDQNFLHGLILRYRIIVKHWYITAYLFVHTMRIQARLFQDCREAKLSDDQITHLCTVVALRMRDKGWNGSADKGFSAASCSGYC